MSKNDLYELTVLRIFSYKIIPNEKLFKNSIETLSCIVNAFFRNNYFPMKKHFILKLETAMSFPKTIYPQSHLYMFSYKYIFHRKNMVLGAKTQTSVLRNKLASYEYFSFTFKLFQIELILLGKNLI